MPAYQFTPDDGMARYYADRAATFQPGEIADWDKPPDPHWSEPDSPPPIPAEPASVRKKSGGDGR